VSGTEVVRVSERGLLGLIACVYVNKVADEVLQNAGLRESRAAEGGEAEERTATAIAIAGVWRWRRRSREQELREKQRRRQRHQRPLASRSWIRIMEVS
jgi:hypothetical protein